ncbi:hypothetical protein [Streptomyces sp. NPDC056387]|uniref:hypothetical protein n=1 Tax=Streptomyces sp. NPDC056387 TaxID=3345803 RepID=UPI0035DEB743
MTIAQRVCALRFPTTRSVGITGESGAGAGVGVGVGLVAAFASLWFSWQSVKAQQTQTQRYGQELVLAVVSKVGWWLASEDNVTQKLEIENRSLSPVYEVTLDLVDSGGTVVRTASPGDRG